MHAATDADQETHGQYLSECLVRDPVETVLSEDGKIAQEKVWKELIQRLEEIEPGIQANIVPK